MSVFSWACLRIFAEPAHGLIDEVPELRPVDLAVAVYAEFDLLPRPRRLRTLTRGSVP